jgi:hypothetical protein
MICNKYTNAYYIIPIVTLQINIYFFHSLVTMDRINVDGPLWDQE